MTLNAVCPNITQTSISSPTFYAKAKDAGVLVPIENVVEAVVSFLEGGPRTDKTGFTVEVGPRGTRETSAEEPMDEESRLSCEIIQQRSRPLQLLSRRFFPIGIESLPDRQYMMIESMGRPALCLRRDRAGSL